MTSEQAYVDGFVKRAAEYGFDETEAMNILKQALAEIPMAGKGKALPPKQQVPRVPKEHMHDIENKPKPVKPLPPEEVF
jgi:hypothetical protein